jgi:hypothetical protein
MAPNLAAAQHDLIRDMIVNGATTYAEIAEAAECSTDAVKGISANLRCYGALKKVCMCIYEEAAIKNRCTRKGVSAFNRLRYNIYFRFCFIII